MKGRIRKFTAVLESAEEGGYVVKCLELPVASEGETEEEAIRNIGKAMVQELAQSVRAVTT